VIRAIFEIWECLLPEDAVHLLNIFEDSGKPFGGASKYTLPFDKGASQSVKTFWSITL
jgi:hypothetical protein